MLRLEHGTYTEVAPPAGRLPSEVLGLEFERDGEFLRLYNPVKGERVPTRLEMIARLRAELDARNRE